jgi:hypothetical protein
VAPRAVEIAEFAPVRQDGVSLPHKLFEPGFAAVRSCSWARCLRMPCAILPKWFFVCLLAMHIVGRGFMSFVPSRGPSIREWITSLALDRGEFCANRPSRLFNWAGAGPFEPIPCGLSGLGGNLRSGWVRGIKRASLSRTKMGWPGLASVDLLTREQLQQAQQQGQLAPQGWA